MNRRKTLAALTAAIVPIPHIALAQSLPTVRVIGPPNDDYKSVYYGIQSGIFRRLGLNVEASVINTGIGAVAALVSGAVDVAVSAPTAPIRGHVRGIPIQIIAPGGLITPANSGIDTILVLKDGPIKRGSDLTGLTVSAAALGESMAIAIQAWIDQTGGDARTVKMVEVPGSAALQMLVEGRVAAAGVNEPAVSMALASGKVRSLAHPLDAISDHFLGGSLSIMATANGDVMRRFARGLREAVVYTNTHPAESAGIVSGYTGIPADVVARGVRFDDAEYIEARYVQPMIDAMAKYGAIDKTFPAADIISPYALKPPNR